jgi:putative ABC transport system permease protein
MGRRVSYVPISDFRTLDQLVASTVAQPRVVTLLRLSFAMVGLVLGAVGVYGVAHDAVSQRVREIGIRIALGAGGVTVIGMVVREGLFPAITGVVLGLAGAGLLSRSLRALVFGVSPTDPLTYVLLSLVLVVVAALASYLPARRAARVDPVVALHTE